MCNRYSAARKEQIRQLIFEMTGVELPDDWHPDFNIPPKNRVPIVLEASPRPARLMQWGTMTKMGFLFNARSATLTKKPLWQEATAQRRCVLFADGFFEFETVGSQTKVGHYFSLPAREVFCIAGLWLPAEDDQPDRCVMVTNEPNGLVAPFHDRMPSILTKETAAKWLSDRPLAQEDINGLCQPYPESEMSEWRSPPEMNSPTFQSPAAIQPWQPEPDLFG